jgi:arylsulfatase A-like enzyme
VTPVKDPNFYTTDAYRDRAVDWIGRQAGKPYFLYLAVNADHGPLQPAATKKYMGRFPDIKDPTRKAFAGATPAPDNAVGAVLQIVRDMGKEENTLVVFFSGNGGPTWQTTAGNLPLRGPKGPTSEGGIGEANDLSEKNPEKGKELQDLYTAWSTGQHAPLWRSPAEKKKAKT